MTRDEKIAAADRARNEAAQALFLWTEYRGRTEVDRAWVEADKAHRAWVNALTNAIDD